MCLDFMDTLYIPSGMIADVLPYQVTLTNYTIHAHSLNVSFLKVIPKILMMDL